MTWHVSGRASSGINFAVGVVTGIPMEFQFGTNWARFSGYAGGVIGLTLAMEGMFAFFAESAFLGLFLFGEKRLGRARTSAPRSCCSPARGSRATSSSSPTPSCSTRWATRVGARRRARSWRLAVAYLFNPWALVAVRAHMMRGGHDRRVRRGRRRRALAAPAASTPSTARIALRIGVIAGRRRLRCSSSSRPAIGTASWSPTTSRWRSRRWRASSPRRRRAELAIIGQPDVAHQRLENPIVVPGALSFLAYGSFGATVHGLDDFPRDRLARQRRAPLLRYHVMVGLGTIFVADHDWRRCYCSGAGRLERTRPMLWILMLALPFPYIATTAGWMTAELGRQPWLVYGLMRTAEGTSPKVCGRHRRVLDARLHGAVPRRRRHLPVRSWRGELAARAGSGGRGALLMAALWYALLGLMLTVYVVLDGFDFGAGIAPPLRRARRGRAAAGLRGHRPGVGRQRGLAARRGRRARVRLSARLRGRLQRLLPAAHDRAVAPGRARAVDRAAPPLGRAAVARLSATCRSRCRRRCWRSCSAPRSATSCAACPSARTATSSRRCSAPAARSISTPCSSGSSPSSCSPRTAPRTWRGSAKASCRRAAGACAPARCRRRRWRSSPSRWRPGACSRRSSPTSDSARWRSFSRRGSWRPWGRQSSPIFRQRDRLAFLATSATIACLLAATAALRYPVILPSTSGRRADAHRRQRVRRRVRVCAWARGGGRSGQRASACAYFTFLFHRFRGKARGGTDHFCGGR